MKQNFFLVPLCWNLHYEGSYKEWTILWGRENLSPRCCWSHSWSQPPLQLRPVRLFFTADQGSRWIGWLAGSGYLWLPAQSPGHVKAPPSTWPVTSDLGPVATTGIEKAWGCRYQAAWAQATNERVSCFHSSCSLVKPWELQNWYFSKSRLLTWLCRQAVPPAVHVYVYCRGGGGLASRLRSAADSLWDFREPFASQEPQFSYLWNGTAGSQ